MLRDSEASPPLDDEPLLEGTDLVLIGLWALVVFASVWVLHEYTGSERSESTPAAQPAAELAAPPARRAMTSNVAR